MPQTKSGLSPTVSIIIVNWNGAQYLPRCLDTIASQTFTDYEIIVVDNASSDHSVDDLENRLPGVRVIRLSQNVGFAAANNKGAHLARGRWLALLNNDAYPEPYWLEKILDAAKHYSEFSFFASHMMQADGEGLIDGTGDVYHVSGLAWHRNYSQHEVQANPEMGEVFSPCAAAAVYDRKAFLDVDGFDEQYVSHHEDVDLGFRLRLRGLRCLYVPDAVVEHVGSASYGKVSDLTVYHVHRNLVWCFFSNMPGHLFWIYLPAHIVANLVFLVYYSLRGQGKVIWRAKLDALRSLPLALRKRREAQKTRRVDSDEISKVMDHGWISPYVLGKRSGIIRRFAKAFGSDRN